MSSNSNVVTRTLRGLLSKLAGQHFGGDRDLYDIFGYPRHLEADDFLDGYLRQDICGRIIDAFPNATWREDPIIKDSDGKGETLATELETLNDQLQIWATLERLDRLMGLGHYGVLLIGVDGGQELREPLRGGNLGLLYLKPHGEQTADVTVWDSNTKSPRYGKPQQYNIRSGVQWAGRGSGQQILRVHHSRVLHVTERSLDDEAIGIPRLERIWNRLMDVDKLLGGSAEVYWQNAAMIRAWVADADVEWDPAEREEMEKQLEELFHRMRRDLRLRGVTPQNLAASPADPGTQIDRQLDFIAGATGIPKRILIGSERGELSSEQDENNWAGRIQERRNSIATPRFVRPLIDYFIRFGIVRYRGKYTVEWPESDVLGEDKRSDIALRKGQAVQAYLAVPGADMIIPPEEFRQWLGEDAESEFEIPDDVDGTIDEEDPDTLATFRRLKANVKPRTLYVSRAVINADAIRKWAKAQGFEQAIPAEDMHVTIAFSRQPLDWMAVGESYMDKLTIPEGGPRVVEALGPKGAVVLHFACSELAWRHEDIKRAGASWDWPSYEPHVTITFDAGDLDFEAVEPYRGEIILGPEIFEELDDDWSSKLNENRRA